MSSFIGDTSEAASFSCRWVLRINHMYGSDNAEETRFLQDYRDSNEGTWPGIEAERPNKISNGILSSTV